MIVSYENANSVGDIDIPISFFEMIHNISMYLLHDDAHDLGFFSYYNRNSHYYQGKRSPDHPSPFHHYQIAIIGLLFAQVGSLFYKGKEMYDSFKKIEGGDLSDLDQSLIDTLETDNTISLDDYNNEVSDIKKINELPSPKKNLLIKANLPL